MALCSCWILYCSLGLITKALAPPAPMCALYPDSVLRSFESTRLLLPASDVPMAPPTPALSAVMILLYCEYWWIEPSPCLMLSFIILCYLWFVFTIYWTFSSANMLFTLRTPWPLCRTSRVLLTCKFRLLELVKALLVALAPTWLKTLCGSSTSPLIWCAASLAQDLAS